MLNSFGISTIRYEDHPAFADVVFDDDPHIETLARALSGALERVLDLAKLPSTDVAHRMRVHVTPEAERLFAALLDKHRQIDGFGEFADRLQPKLIEIAAEDLGVAADRGTHAYIDHSAQADGIAHVLYDKGFWRGQFDAAAVRALDEAVTATKAVLWERHEREGRKDRESLSTNRWDGETARKLGAVFNEPAIVTAISNYMGGRYGYSGCAFELSVPGTDWWSSRYGREDESAETAYYHLDQSSRFPKMLCYLTDVSAETGPTSLVSLNLSHSLLSRVSGRALDGISLDPNRGDDTSMAKMLVCTPAGRRCFAALPKEMRCLGHFGNDILAGSAEERYIVDHRDVMTGPAGSFAVFDGSRVAHRGGIVKERHRWAFQVLYAKLA
jgi:hypothetical protein